MKNNTLFTLYVFQVLNVLLIKIRNTQLLDLLFPVVFINRYHFSQIFRTSLNIILKKDFRHKFSFFNGFTQTSHPLNDQNPLITKVFCQCSLYK